MNQTLPLLLAASLLAPATTARANNDATIECLKSATFLAPIDSPDYRKYAPDREIQVLHLALDVTPDFKLRTLEGKTTIRFQPIAKPVQELRLDAVDLTLRSVTATQKIQAHQITEKNAVTTF